MSTATKKMITVQVSDAKVSADPEAVIVTYSLGSCIAVALYDPGLSLGGMLHFQLPESKMDTQRAEREPFMFCDSGMEKLLDNMIKRGANKSRMIVKIAGGAAMKAGPKGFDIGKRNVLALRKVLWKHGLLLKGQDVGGDMPRNFYLHLLDGTILVRTNGTDKKL